MKDIALIDLLKAGVHFGHKSSKWNPKMKPYIFGHRNNIHIFDLEKTKDKMKDALVAAKDTAARGGTILFVGTKKQARGIVKSAAERAGMPYVVERWLGGTFTNFRTIQKSMRKLDKLQTLKETGEIEAYTKKERLLMDREIEKLKRLFSGVEGMKDLPSLVFVLSAEHDRIAVKEANRVNIPVVGIVDTNTDPEGITHVIPGNDDSVQSIELYANLMADAVLEGRKSATPVVVEKPQVQANA